MKVLEATTYQYLLPTSNKEAIGKIGDKVYGTFVGKGEQTALVDFQGRMFTMDASLLNNKKQGDQLAFEIMGLSDNKISLKYLEEEVTQTNRSAYTRTTAYDNMSTSKMFDLIGALENKQGDSKAFNGEVKEYVDQVISKATQEDLKQLTEEGYNPEKMDLEDLSKALSRMKGKTTNTASDSELEALVSKYENMTSNTEQLESIIQKLKQAHMPVNQYTISKVMKAMKQLEGVADLSQTSMAYLMKNNKELTLENLYKAQHANHGNQGNDHAQTVDFEALEDQIANRLLEMGLEANEEEMETARWFIENEIPLTQETLETYDYLKGLKEMEPSEHIDLVVKGLSENKNPKEITLNSKTPTNDVQNEAIEEVRDKVEGIEEQQIKYVIRRNIPLTIQALHEAKAEVLPAELELSKSQETDYVTAKRQVEEIRLKLTYDAAQRLVKNGIEIETKPLDQVVEALKQMEQQRYYELFQEAGIEATQEQVQQLQNTTDKVEALKGFPMTLLGRFVNKVDAEEMNLENLHQAGLEEKLNLEKAQEMYETLKTVPRKDLGDFLSKTYEQIEPLLKEMGLETTQANIRAVKMLAYHSMPLTEDNIITGKILDAKVNQVLKTLHPATILEMIKSGKNPLDLSVDKLMSEIENLQDRLGITKQEKISTYLVQMEKTQGLTQEEREGLIGVYRLLHGIEKSEGKVISYLMKTEQEMTLKNLLTATRALHHKSVDVEIDDTFGMLEGLEGETLNIEKQIQRAFSEGTLSVQAENEAAYYEALVEQFRDLATPERLSLLSKEEGALSLPLEQLVEALEGINIQQDQQGIQKRENIQYEQIQQLQQVKQETFSLMEQLKIPLTIKNILNTQLFMEEDSSLGKLIKKTVSHLDPSQKKKIEHLLTNFLHVSEADQVSEGLQELKEELNQMYRESAVNGVPEEVYRTFEQMENLLTLENHFEKNHFFQVPMLIDGQITQLNVHYIKGQEENKKEVVCSFESETFGVVKGKMDIKDQGIELQISFESREGAALFKDQLDYFKEVFTAMGHEIQNLSFNAPPNPNNYATRSHEGRYDRLI